LSSRLLVVLAISYLVPACSSPPESATDASSADAAAPVDASDAAAADASRSPDAGDVSDAGMASVTWTTEVEPVTIDSDVGLDYFYQYEVALVGDVFSYSLDLERCIQIAGMPETCETLDRNPLEFTSGIRWGIDPSMYAVGENHYRFTLTLRQGTNVVATDTLELVATVTSCTECVGS
jgi:hypothetical protein